MSWVPAAWHGLGVTLEFLLILEVERSDVLIWDITGHGDDGSNRAGGTSGLEALSKIASCIKELLSWCSL